MPSEASSPCASAVGWASPICWRWRKEATPKTNAPASTPGRFFVVGTGTGTGTGFDALGKANEAAIITISLVMQVPAPLKSIADRVIRSASSVPANLAEGRGRSGRDRLHHWRIAYGSAREVDTHLHLLIGTGSVGGSRADKALQLFDDVRAITWRLLHPKPSLR